MSGVQTAAEMQSRSTGVLYEVVDTINLDITSMENAYQNISTSAARMSDVYHQMNASAAVMSDAYQGMGVSAAAVSDAYRNVNASVDETSTDTANEAYLHMALTASRTRRYISENTEEQAKFNNQVEAGANKAGGLLQKIKGAVAPFMNLEKLSEAFDLSDQMAATTARLNLMNDGLQSTEELQNMIFAAAERSRGSYQATADAVAALGFTAEDAFGSTEETVAFVEQISKQFAIAGMGASDIDGAMQLLTQTMGEGVLGGAEYNRILSQAPNIIETIADYLGVPGEQLEHMAAEGQITADIVKAAMFAAADETNAKFEQMPQTFAQIAVSFRNNALMAFEPVLQKMNEIANSEAVQGLVNGAAAGIAVVAGIALELLDLLADVAGVVADNWSWLLPIILGVAAALAVYYGCLALGYGWQLLCAAATGIMTVAQQGLNAVMDANPILRVVMIMLVLIGVIYAICTAIADATHIANSGFGVITGGIAVVGAFFKNLGLTIANIALGIGNAIGAVCSNIGTAFHNVIANVKGWWFGLLSDVLSVIAGIAEALNEIPFVSFDYSGVVKAADEYAAKSAAAYESKEEYQSISDAFNEGLSTYEAWEENWVQNAFDSGADWGDGVAESISSLFGGDKQSEDPYEYERYDEAVIEGIEGIDDNTGAIRDSMEITEEDLRYLRDIAEQEAVNRFTTAEIIIEQTNHNNVSGRMDLDGIVSGLTDAANEAVAVIAEGVYA